MQGEIRALTGLRGWAATMVVAYHSSELVLPAGAPTAFQSHGYLWVDLFFVLSGFVMALTYAGRFATLGAWAAMPDFLLRRIARIYPLYAVVTLTYAGVLALGLAASGPYPKLGQVLVLNLLMVQGWGLAPSLSGTAWSISTEWFAYLLFPASLFLALRGGWGRAGLLLLPALAALLAMTWAADPPLAYLETPRRGPFDMYYAASLWPLARTVAEFSLGLLAYRVFAVKWAWDLWANPMTAAVTAGAIVALMAQPGTDIFIVPLFPLLVLTLAVGEHFLARLFASPPLHALGVLSYAIYMLHPRTNRAITALLTRLAEITGPLGPIAMPALSFVLLLAVATLAYWGVEKPGRRMIRGLSAAAPRARRPSTGVRS